MSSSDTEPRVLSTTTVDTLSLQHLAALVRTPESETIDVVAPATNESIGAVPNCSKASVGRAVERSRRAQKSWKQTSISERSAIINRFADLVLERQKWLLDLVQVETGKSRTDAVEELLDVPQTCSYYAESVTDELTPTVRRGALPPATTAKVVYEPVGVVGVISPWNYPLTLSVTDAVAALIGGNTIVLKPDEKTPFIALALCELLTEAGLPDDVFQVVTGEGAVVGSKLIDTVDYITFTGSTETGRVVAARAGENLIDCSLELGGKNPLIVLDDADIETAARGAVQACFTNAGQLCLSTERLYVDESVFDSFISEFIGATRRLTLGTETTFDAEMGSLINQKQLDRVESHVSDAVTHGAEVLTGGRRRTDIGPFCYEPTVLTNVTETMQVATEETFGPVVSVYSVSGVTEAITKANDSMYGLNASVWSKNQDRAQTVASQLDCGTVCINDGYIAGWAAVDTPMGGVKHSGLGRRHGPEGLHRFMEPKTVATSQVGPITAPAFLPNAWYIHGLIALTRIQRRIQSLSKQMGSYRRLR